MNNSIDPSLPSEDFLSVPLNPVAMPSAFSGNSNIWKPKLDKTVSEYVAKVRLLPQGIEGIRNKTYPSVRVCTHYLYDLRTRTSKTVKCRKTFGDKEPCPICDNIWARWRAVVEQTGNKDSGKPYLKLTSTPEWYTNTLIIQDDAHNEFSGQVKIWQHSDAMERKLMDPTVPEPPKTYAPGAIIPPPKRMFTPYCHINGVNFIVNVKYNKEKQMNEYDGCFWEQMNTPLATNENELRAILDQCHDLTKLFEDVPSVEAATIAVNEYWAEVEQKMNSGAVVSNPVRNVTAALNGQSAAPLYQPPTAPQYQQPQQNTAQQFVPQNVQASTYGGQFLGGAQPQTEQQYAAPAAPQYQAPAAAQYQAPAAPQYTAPAAPAAAPQYVAPAAQAAAAPQYQAPAAAPAAQAIPGDVPPESQMLPPGDDDGELPF